MFILVPWLCGAQLQSSGPISLGDVRTEAGGSGAYSINDGRLAFSLTQPTAMSDFYGQSSDAITVTPASKTANSNGETWSVTVTSTGAWQVLNKPSWITMNTSGSGSGSVSITASANNTGQSRNVSLLFELTSDGSVNDSHSVFQFPN